MRQGLTMLRTIRRGCWAPLCEQQASAGVARA